MDITSANVYSALFLPNMSKLDIFGTALFSNSQFTGGFKVGCSKPIRFLRLIYIFIDRKRFAMASVCYIPAEKARFGW